MREQFFLILLAAFFWAGAGFAGAEDFLARKAIADFSRIQKEKAACERPRDCMPFVSKLMDEDARPMSLGIVTSNVYKCQSMIDQSKSRGKGQGKTVSAAQKFGNPEELQQQFAKMFPEIGAGNHQKISACNSNEDLSARYKISKFYYYNKRFNEGATKVVEELSAINSLLGQADPLPCEGKGTIDQAFKRCEQLTSQCKAGASQLDAVAATSEVDEAQYLIYKGAVENLDRSCLLSAEDYERHAKNVTAANPEVTQFEEVFVERQAPRKICTIFNWKKKQEIQQCETAKRVLMLSMNSLEDQNPWFRGSLYFKERKTKSVKESIRTQVLSNRSELKKKMRQFRDASLCVNGFMSANQCDSGDVRTLLNETPDLSDLQGSRSQDSAAIKYLEAQSCTEDDYQKRKKKSETINGLALDATVLVATAGFSGIASVAKVAWTVRGAMVARSAYLGTLAVSAFYASKEYKSVVNSCSAHLDQVRKSVENNGAQCPGPKSNLSQSQKQLSECVISSGSTILAALPLAVPAIKALSRVGRAASVESKVALQESAALSEASAQRVASAPVSDDLVVDEWSRARAVRQKVEYETVGPQVVRQAPIRTSQFSKKTGQMLETRDGSVTPYGSRTEDLNELKKYQAAITATNQGKGKVQHATMVIEGKFDHNILSFMAKEAPDVTLVESIRLSSGKKYAVVLRKGNNSELKLGNPELATLSEADKSAVAALEHSIQTGGYNSVEVTLEAVQSAQKKAQGLTNSSQKEAVSRALGNDEKIAGLDANIDRLTAKKNLSVSELQDLSRLQKEKQAVMNDQVAALSNGEVKRTYQDISSESFNEVRARHLAESGYLSPGHLDHDTSEVAMTRALAAVGKEQSNYGAKAAQIAAKPEESGRYVSQALEEAKVRRSVNDIAAKNELENVGSAEYQARIRRRELGFQNPEGENVTDAIPLDNSHIMLDTVAGRNPEQYVKNGVVEVAGDRSVFDAKSLRDRLDKTEGFTDYNETILVDPKRRVEGLAKNARSNEVKLNTGNPSKASLEDTNIERLELAARDLAAKNKSKANILAREKYQNFNRELANLSSKNKEYGLEYERINREIKKLKAKPETLHHSDMAQKLEQLTARKTAVEAEKIKLQQAVTDVKASKTAYLAEAVGPTARLHMLEEVRVNGEAATKLTYHVDTRNQVMLYEEGLGPAAVRPSHSQLAGRRDPVIAGEIYLRKTSAGTWEISEINDGSGHFRPNAKNLEFVRALLEKDYGIRIPKDVRLVHGTTRDMNSAPLGSPAASSP